MKITALIFALLFFGCNIEEKERKDREWQQRLDSFCVWKDGIRVGQKITNPFKTLHIVEETKTFTKYQISNRDIFISTHNDTVVSVWRKSWN